jgi:hypothetical protein
MYLKVTSHPRFPTIVDILFMMLALVALADVILLGLDGPGITSFSERVGLVSAVVALVLVVIGVFHLHRSRPEAYRWFERGLLVQIFVVQIFVFAEEQLAGTIGLVIVLIAWVLLQGAIRAERESSAMAAAA